MSSMIVERASEFASPVSSVIQGLPKFEADSRASPSSSLIPGGPTPSSAFPLVEPTPTTAAEPSPSAAPAEPSPTSATSDCAEVAADCGAEAASPVVADVVDPEAPARTESAQELYSALRDEENNSYFAVSYDQASPQSEHSNLEQRVPVQSTWADDMESTGEAEAEEVAPEAVQAIEELPAEAGAAPALPSPTSNRIRSPKLDRRPGAAPAGEEEGLGSPTNRVKGYAVEELDALPRKSLEEVRRELAPKLLVNAPADSQTGVTFRYFQGVVMKAAVSTPSTPNSKTQTPVKVTPEQGVSKRYFQEAIRQAVSSTTPVKPAAPAPPAEDAWLATQQLVDAVPLVEPEVHEVVEAPTPVAVEATAEVAVEVAEVQTPVKAAEATPSKVAAAKATPTRTPPPRAVVAADVEDVWETTIVPAFVKKEAVGSPTACPASPSYTLSPTAAVGSPTRVTSPKIASPKMERLIEKTTC